MLTFNQFQIFSIYSLHVLKLVKKSRKNKIQNKNKFLKLQFNFSHI